jgi:hypothetical protein
MKLDVRLAAALFVLAACEAGGNYGFGGSGASSGGDDDGDGVKAGTPASTTGFLTGGDATGTTGSGVMCSDDGCITDADQMPCDSGLAVDSADAMDAAKAIGLCKVSNGTGWGVVSAAYTTSDGQPLTGVFADGRGVLSHFGNTIQPREGAAMLALSSGAARGPGDPGYQSPSGYNKAPSQPHGLPSGFTLQESPACNGSVTTGEPYDSAMLELKIKTPTNAKSFTYNLDFYTYEFPNYICSTFNDYFVALMTPPPAGSIQSNISFDGNMNFISVNAGFMQVCDSQTASNGVVFPCSLGQAELVGTGFDDASFNIYDFTDAMNSAATSWLQTSAPVESPGSEITLRFAIWDSGDADLDSTILIDNFKFSFEEGTTETTPVPQ